MDSCHWSITILHDLSVQSCFCPRGRNVDVVDFVIDFVVVVFVVVGTNYRYDGFSNINLNDLFGSFSICFEFSIRKFDVL